MVRSVISVLMELTKTKLNRKVVLLVLRERTLCILELPSVEVSCLVTCKIELFTVLPDQIIVIN